ncbi:c-type cytochrome [Luteimonas granuli]|uniref:Cytochrome c n=1 Tax=Luteimonas granuli TaxID=1176533 RepID=A0A518N6Q7_9GAMM|nr:c-type cytochrome [Luteimonas granuli]QDW67597.1 cytochrome c [Luteimonas granuli]
MTCAPGKPCEEGLKRRRALWVLLLMALIFGALSVFSFLDSRGQLVPANVSYGAHDAVEGKRVFQAYNCMGCHTIVGNGAYFGPDLTNTWQAAGPAWLEAFLPSPAGWPTGPAVQVQLQRPEVAAASGTSSLDEYFRRYPAAAERVRRRGGSASHMPNLPFREGEVGRLIAFLKYTSEMNTEGWPPKPRVDGLRFALATPMPGVADASAGTVAMVAASAAPDDPAALGKRIASEFGCVACHASDSSSMVGPGWGGLHGSTITLGDGSTIEVDDAYVATSIRNPNEHIAAGYAAGTMPSYDTMLDDDQVAAIVAYIRTLSGEGQ